MRRDHGREKVTGLPGSPAAFLQRGSRDGKRLHFPCGKSRDGARRAQWASRTRKNTGSAVRGEPLHAAWTRLERSILTQKRRPSDRLFLSAEGRDGKKLTAQGDRAMITVRSGAPDGIAPGRSSAVFSAAETERAAEAALKRARRLWGKRRKSHAQNLHERGF